MQTGHRDVQIVADQHEIARRMQRNVVRGRLVRPHAARTAMSEQRFDRAVRERDAADRVIAAIGDEQRVAPARETLRIVEARFALEAIGKTRISRAELAQHAAFVRAFEHAMMARVGDEEILRIGEHLARKRERQPRLGTKRGRRRDCAPIR